MSLQSAAPVVLAFARYFTRPFCPQCGDAQLIPEHSEFVGGTVVHHTWWCETCDNVFDTAVEFVTP